MMLYLKNIHQENNNKMPAGIYSICSANPYVIKASMLHSLATDTPLLVESTCNQVNQFGGYTGMTPGSFVDWLHTTAAQAGFPKEKILIGGDHLGPYPWKEEPASQAMEKACQLVHDCVLAGYTKIHVDASMKCGDDRKDLALDTKVSANRAVDLVMAAERAKVQLGADNVELCYVIGTEVPSPGGIEGDVSESKITDVADVEITINLTKQAFIERGLEDAWDRVIAIVVQPGVEFNQGEVLDYRRETAKELSQYIEKYDGLVYEVHSTDYQTQTALKELVEDHFAILKVGPALTFAFREAVFSLAMIEEELYRSGRDFSLSNIRSVLDRAMLDNPVYWKSHYFGRPERQAYERMFSLSDRCRYYWSVPTVQTALKRLLSNLDDIPLELLSQYLPVQYEHVRDNLLLNKPSELIIDKIISIINKYSTACGIYPVTSNYRSN